MQKGLDLQLGTTVADRSNCFFEAYYGLPVQSSKTLSAYATKLGVADFFAKDRAIPPVKRDDLLSIFTAGAYGFTMASNYNARPTAAEVLVDGDKFTVIRKRQSYEDMITLEK